MVYLINNLNKFFLILISMVILFAKELIIINQEFFIILAFLLVKFFSLKHFLGDAIKDELNARQSLIIKSYLNLEEIYQKYLNKKLELLKRSYFLVFEMSKFLEITSDYLYDILPNRVIISISQNRTLVIVRLNLILLNTFINKTKLIAKKLAAEQANKVKDKSSKDKKTTGNNSKQSKK